MGPYRIMCRAMGGEVMYVAVGSWEAGIASR